VCGTAAGSAITPVTATVMVWAFDQPGPRPPEHAHRYGHLPTGTRYGSSIEVATARPSQNRRDLKRAIVRLISNRFRNHRNK